MTLRIDVAELFSSSLVIGNTGLGVLAESVPPSGQDGPSILYNDLSFPSDTGKEVLAKILTWPSAGTLFVYEDGSFTFTGPDGTYFFTYQLYVDGVSTGSPATVTLNVGNTTSLGATAVGSSNVTASITTAIRLGSDLYAVSSSSASLTTAIKLAASAVSVSTASAALSGSSAALLEAFMQARSTGTARLTVQGTSNISPAARLTITYIVSPFEIKLL